MLLVSLVQCLANHATAQVLCLELVTICFKSLGRVILYQIHMIFAFPIRVLLQIWTDFLGNQLTLPSVLFSGRYWLYWGQLDLEHHHSWQQQ